MVLLVYTLMRFDKNLISKSKIIENTKYSNKIIGIGENWARFLLR